MIHNLPFFYLDKLLIESWSFWIFATMRFCSSSGGITPIVLATLSLLRFLTVEPVAAIENCFFTNEDNNK